MALRFKWDDRKAADNAAKHGVSFFEAVSVFGDPFSMTIVDPVFARPEDERYVTIGVSNRQQILVVVHWDQEDRIRIISARKATKRERKVYEEGANH